MPRATLLTILAAAALSPLLQERPVRPGYTDTPRIPGSTWRVHDADRPPPPVVAPGRDGRPPEDALVLFDGTDLRAWTSEGGPARWRVDEGVLVAGGGDLSTREAFGDCQLHIEWAAPVAVQGEGQGRGNSGVFLMGRYEVQVLDSWNNRTYADGQAAALYGQAPPMVNASLPPGEWQSYDIVFRSPRFADGEVVSPALVTVLHNGLVVHHARAFLGATGHRKVPSYEEHPPQAPLVLQDHGNPVRYRNVWIRPLELP